MQTISAEKLKASPTGVQLEPVLSRHEYELGSRSEDRWIQSISFTLSYAWSARNSTQRVRLSVRHALRFRQKYENDRTVRSCRFHHRVAQLGSSFGPTFVDIPVRISPSPFRTLQTRLKSVKSTKHACRYSTNKSLCLEIEDRHIVYGHGPTQPFILSGSIYELQLDVITSQWWQRHLVNAYEVKAGMG